MPRDLPGFSPASPPPESHADKIDASVWSHSEYSLEPGRYRLVHETMPIDTDRASPHGAPIAITKSPSFSFAESPIRRLMSAMFSGLPIIFAQ